jgi:GT2 family glycosyltransferase
MDVAIVIPVFNQVHYTKMCLDSLRESGVQDSQIVVVDNGSTDDTPACLAARPGLRVIHNETNLGCGAAWNQGTKAMNGTWTVVLNNDVLAPRGWLEGLLSFAEEERYDVVSPAFGNGEDDYDVPAYAQTFMRKMAHVYRNGVAAGICFMVHRRVFDAVGLFDGDARLGGYEDDEFFRRCSLNGFRMAITGRSFLHHFGSITQKAIKAGLGKPKASLGDKDYYRNKYSLTWFKRHRWRIQRQVRACWWRLSERARYGCTLVFWRQKGRFDWR